MCGQRDPTAAGLGDDVFMVFGGFESEQRQPEAVLASTLTVTAAAIAAVLGEDRDYLADEINCRVVTKPINMQWNLNSLERLAASLLPLRGRRDRHLSRAIRQWNNQAFFDSGE